ncbi:toll/interleukin-1 receptor domain-containing protein, partial [bacterium]|nr:toll/interleukin-1 receptor domain-containing protein [bacterium]
MTQIFISYRREESAGEAGRLADRLIQKHGSEKLFMDIDSIDPGTDFVVKLQEALQSCEIVLAFIGRNWLNITDKRGRRRIEDPDDFVHIELA